MDLCKEMKDKSSQEDIIFFGAFTLIKLRIPMAINSMKSVRTLTNTPLFLMICSLVHFFCWITPDFWIAFFLFHITFCVLGFVNISPLNLSVHFWRGPFSIWTDSKRGNSKAMHPLLSNITTCEASTRHCMTCVSLFSKQTNPKHVDSGGCNWLVLAVCIVMLNKWC